MPEEGQAALTDGEEDVPMASELPSDAVDPDYDPGDETETDYDLGEKTPMTHGVKIRGKVKRGEGTRDQDELVIEGRGECAAEAVADFEAALKAAEDRDWADRLRDMQPGEDDTEEEDDG